jgi:alpha-soluble NSF attachment protein
MEACEIAAGWYESDNAEAYARTAFPTVTLANIRDRLANKLYLKVGDLAGLLDDWPKAIQNFGKVAAAFCIE